MKLKSILSAMILAGVLTAAPADKKAEPAEVKDPVCGMTVDPKTSEKADYNGKTYYFCSREEKETFQKTPEKFVPAAAKKSEKK